MSIAFTHAGVDEMPRPNARPSPTIPVKESASHDDSQVTARPQPEAPREATPADAQRTKHERDLWTRMVELVVAQSGFVQDR
jgi:hypothetical protein